MAHEFNDCDQNAAGSLQVQVERPTAARALAGQATQAVPLGTWLAGQLQTVLPVAPLVVMPPLQAVQLSAPAAEMKFAAHGVHESEAPVRLLLAKPAAQLRHCVGGVAPPDFTPPVWT